MVKLNKVHAPGSRFACSPGEVLTGEDGNYLWSRVAPLKGGV